MSFNSQGRNIPEKCPICNIKKKNILLHIQLKEECRQKIDNKKFEEWREMAKKKSKRKFQIKNVDSGNHMRLQDKYSKTKKAKQTRHIGYLRKKLINLVKLISTNL